MAEFAYLARSRYERRLVNKYARRGEFHWDYKLAGEAYEWAHAYELEHGLNLTAKEAAIAFLQAVLMGLQSFGTVRGLTPRATIHRVGQRDEVKRILSLGKPPAKPPWSLDP